MTAVVSVLTACVLLVLPSMVFGRVAANETTPAYTVYETSVNGTGAATSSSLIVITSWDPVSNTLRRTTTGITVGTTKGSIALEEYNFNLGMAFFAGTYQGHPLPSDTPCCRSSLDGAPPRGGVPFSKRGKPLSLGSDVCGAEFAPVQCFQGTLPLVHSIPQVLCFKAGADPATTLPSPVCHFDPPPSPAPPAAGSTLWRVDGLVAAARAGGVQSLVHWTPLAKEQCTANCPHASN